MKFQHLTMQAFGPFGNTAKVDFEALNAQGLFAICGPTGSGKSTLLDALTYALFGETTGGERDGRDMRSHHAQANLPTQIELIFSLGPARYRITRSPEQQVQKRRGTNSALSTQAHTATMDIDTPGGWVSLAQRVHAVREEVQRLVRLTPDQFRKVVVLPQGKFAEILREKAKADQDNQMELFELLFGTGWVEQLESQLKEAMKGQQEALRSHQDALIQLQTSGEFSDISVLRQRMAERIRRLKHLESRQGQLQQILKARRKREEQVRDEIQAWNEFQQATEHALSIDQERPTRRQQRQALERANQAAEVQRFVQEAASRAEQLCKIEAEVQDAQRLLDQAQQAFQRARQADSQRPQLLTEREQAAIRRSELERFEALLQNLEKQRQEQGKKLRQVDEAKANITQIEFKLQQLRHQCQQWGVQAEEQRQLASQRPSHDARLKELEELQALVKQVQEKRDSAAQKEKSRNTLATTVDEAKQMLQTRIGQAKGLQELYLQNQARVLAGELEEGKPCPVCGSLHHPQPASTKDLDTDNDHDSSPTRTKIDEANRAVEEQREAFEKQRRQLQELEQELAGLQGELRPLLEKTEPWLGREQTLETDIKGVRQQAKQAAEAEKQVEQILKRRLSLEQKELPETQQQLESLRERLKALEEEEIVLRVQVDEGQNQIPSEYPTLEVLRKAQNEHQRLLALLERQLRDLTTGLEVAAKAQTQAEESLRHAQMRLIEAREQADDALRKKHSELIQRGFVKRSEDDGHSDDPQPDEESWALACLSEQERRSLAEALSQFDQTASAAQDRFERAKLALHLERYPESTTWDFAVERNRMEQQRQKLHHATTASEARTLRLAKYLATLNEKQRRDEDLEKSYRHKVAELESKRGEMAAGSQLLGWVQRGPRAAGVGEELSFRQYVLGRMMQPALVRANHRLQMLSRGRYHLSQTSRLLTTPRGSKQLLTPGLTIYDQFTGRLRPISTLSGGETFQLSLALALGLAESITERHGGIQLETVFIDEGFGTLDSESLDLAIRVLMGLRESGRVVGVISHVEEVQKRVGQGIIVSKDSDGTSRLIMDTE
jgi:exonuclease SbcC